MEDRTTPREELVYELADLFKLFGDSTRLNILYALRPGELGVSGIADALSMTQSAISHQLRLLKQNKLVKSRRDGKAMLYSLADDHVHTILSQGMDHITE